MLPPSRADPAHLRVSPGHTACLIHPRRPLCPATPCPPPRPARPTAPSRRRVPPPQKLRKSRGLPSALRIGTGEARQAEIPLLYRSVNIEEIPCRGADMECTESELAAEYQRASSKWPFIHQTKLAHGLPNMLPFPVRSRETNLTNEVGDNGHGHGI